MPFQLEIRSADMEEYDREVTVVDVYDLASVIGREFEKIIDAHGTDAVVKLMPKVIHTLELLEILAAKNERENTLVEDLQARISLLENEKIERAEERQRFEKELEQIEEHWRDESKSLLSLVTKLQEENRKLSTALAEKSGNSPVGASPEVDVTALQSLQFSSEQLREELRLKDRELHNKNVDIENLSSQVERLGIVVKELRRKHRSCQNQIRNFIDERADFLAQLQDHQRELNSLRQHLGIAQKENEDLAMSNSEVPDLRNKVIYDLEDPNRPRFTTDELKEILHERNELKARVSDLEDELEAYRPKKESHWSYRQRRREPAVAVVMPCTPSPSPQSASTSIPPIEMDDFTSPWKKHFSDNNEEDEDPPVQGPLPLEPDDAPWKKSESGIRKFFQKYFSESKVPFLGTSPKRSLSSLSKMALSSSSAVDTSV